MAFTKEREMPVGEGSIGGGSIYTLVKTYTGAVLSGATFLNVVDTALLSTDKVIGAALREVATNSVSIRAVEVAAGSFTITLSGDPGASGADFNVTIGRLA
jgi:hypothetical protein